MWTVLHHWCCLFLSLWKHCKNHFWWFSCLNMKARIRLCGLRKIHSERCHCLKPDWIFSCCFNSVTSTRVVQLLPKQNTLLQVSSSYLWETRETSWGKNNTWRMSHTDPNTCQHFVIINSASTAQDFRKWLSGGGSTGHSALPWLQQRSQNLYFRYDATQSCNDYVNLKYLVYLLIYFTMK